jgi:hypothetical protein
VPHWAQNRASSGFCLPQLVQNGIAQLSSEFDPGPSHAHTTLTAS